MHSPKSPHGFSEAFAIDQIADALAGDGFGVFADAVSPSLLCLLREEALAYWREGSFRQAKIGRGEGAAVQSEIRGDQIYWLESGPNTPPGQALWLGQMESLRGALNQALFLALESYEGHLAMYPEGAHYRPHLDQHRDTASRLITLIAYFNEDWQPGHGGQLRLYTEPNKGVAGPYIDVAPTFGTVVVFRSAEFWHEVLPARKARTSLTGWFRVRPSTGIPLIP